MTKTDLPYNSAGHLGPAGDWGNYSKRYDENRSAIQYCWWPETCWWLGEIIRKGMTKTYLPYNSGGHLGPAGDSGKLFEKLWRKQICHTILLVTWDLLVTGEIIRKGMTKTDFPYNTAGYLGPAGDCGNYSKSYDENRSSYNTAGNLGPAIWPVWRDSRFSTICAKISMLNLIIDKVTVSMIFKSNPNQRNSRRHAPSMIDPALEAPCRLVSENIGFGVHPRCNIS